MENKSFFTLLFLVVGCWTALSAGDIWSSCGTSKDHLQITTVKISPDPPVRGQNLTVMVAGSLDENVTSGEVHVYLTWGGSIVFLNQTYSLCDLATAAGTSCPIVKGPRSYTINHEIPDELLKGSYFVNVQAWDQHKENITCVDVSFKLT